MKQYLIEDLVKMRGVCFQVTPKTSEAFQVAWLESKNLGDDENGFRFINKSGYCYFGYFAPKAGELKDGEAFEQVILAPEKFNSQRELMEFLVMGGEIVHDIGYRLRFSDDGNFISSNDDDFDYDHLRFVRDWKPRIDKSKIKWFLAWVDDCKALVFVRANENSSDSIDVFGNYWDNATSITDTELAEFGLKRINTEKN